MAKKKHLLLCSALALAGITATTAAIAVRTAATAENGWSERTLLSEYSYKETLALGDKTYVYGNESYEASAVVCYPDGTTSAASELRLDQVGIYTVKYSVEIGGKVYAQNEQFLVNYPAYSVGNDKSSVSYGTPDRASTPGVIARIAQGDKLSFTQYIDFTKVTVDDALLRGYVTPDLAGSMDFTELIITFTDSVDESISFSVHYYGYDWTYNTYVAAGGHNQAPVGMHQSEGLKVGNGYGLWCYVPLNSKGDDPATPGVSERDAILAPDNSQFFVSMNYQEKKLYTHGYPSTVAMIADLDDTSDTDGSIKFVDDPWTGFPSGKARLSISAYGHTGATANLCITEVFGIPAKDLVDNLYIDNDIPAITLEEGFEDGMPAAVVGCEYAIPAATAYDAYGYDCKVQATVWYNYGLANQVNVPVKNGKFTVSKAGTYAIEYATTDKVGNPVTVQKWIRAFESMPSATFELPAEKDTASLAGEWTAVPEVSPDAVVGGSGKNTIATYVEFNGERELINGGFRPMNVGTYKVVYVATDYIGQKVEASYEVVVTAGTAPLLERDFDFYPVYIAGAEYALPAYYAYYYNGTSMERNLCDIVVTDANGTHTYTAGETVKFLVANNGDSITFDVQSKGVSLSTHEAVGVLAWLDETRGKIFHVENYLVGSGFMAEKTDGAGIILTATENSMEYTFANALSADVVSLKIQQLLNVTNGATLRVTLKDVLDASNSVSVCIGANGQNSYMEANGERKTVLTAFGGNDSSFAISYNNGTFTVNGISIDASALANFETNKIFLSVALENCGVDAMMTFLEVGNCIFGLDKSDRVAPVIFSQYETGGSFKPGAQYEIKAPVCYDVYSPNLNYVLNVYDPMKNPVKDVNGLTLSGVDPTKDYTIQLSDIGQYIVEYVVSEGFTYSRANETSLLYTLTVADEVPPTIAWKGAFQSTAKVGDVIVMPEYTVADNVDAAESIIVCFYVETPADQLIMLPGNAIEVTQVGVYEFRVMVVDASGNITTETHYLTVTEKGDN